MDKLVLRMCGQRVAQLERYAAQATDTVHQSLYQIYFFNFQSIVFFARRQIFENGGFRLMIIKHFSAYSCS